MEDEEIPNFASKEEERIYWKEAAMQWRERVDELEKELIDFQDNSSQLEKELEKSLEQADRANRDLRTKCNRLTLDLDMCRVSFPLLVLLCSIMSMTDNNFCYCRRNMSSSVISLVNKYQSSRRKSQSIGKVKKS